MADHVEVKGVPGVRVRLLSAREFFDLQRIVKGDAEDRDERFMLGLVQACALGKDGKPRWADVEAVAGEPIVTVNKIAEAALAHNGMGDEQPGEA